MFPSAITIAALTVVLASPHSRAGAQALSCEELRSGVEAKIRGNGVANFEVTVVEAASTAQGQVVGTCERGAKKLVYLQANATGPAESQPRRAASASAAAPGKPKALPIVTECADGRVITTGNCKSP